MTEAPNYRVRRHPIVIAAERNARARTLIADVVPEYVTLEAVAEQARALREELSATAQEPSVYPSTPDAVTADWLKGEVARRQARDDAQVSISVLQELEFGARSDGINLIDMQVEEMISVLGEQLSELVDDLRTHVDALGDDVDTAAQAIEASTTEHWKAISDRAADYQDIRHVQRVLYRSCEGRFDELAAGAGVAGADPEARLFYHRNLDEVAPNWRGFIDTNGVQQPSQVPWPADEVERLVWCVRRDSGIWCPTPPEINAALAEVPKRLAGGNRQGQKLPRSYSPTGGYLGPTASRAHGFSTAGAVR